MKKILILCIFFLLMHKVYAFEENEWTDEVINDSNIIVKDSEIRYRWYQEEKVISPNYYIEGENDSEYPFIIRDDYIETNWSNWFDTSPEIKANRNIEYTSANRYRTIKPIRYLFLENVEGGFLIFNIAELNVLINNIEVNVTMNCNNCSNNFNYYVNNNSLNDEAYIYNGGSLMIDLGAYYFIDNIRLELYMYDSVPNTKKFDLYYNGCPNLNECNYAHKEIDIFVVSSNYNQPEKHLIMPDATFIENPIWDDWIYIDGFVNAMYCRQMQVVSLHRYKDIKYHYYKINRVYTDGYYKIYNDPTYLRDEASAKTFYLYEYIPEEIKQEDIKDGSNNVINTINPDNREVTVVSNSNNGVKEVIKINEMGKEPKIVKIEDKKYSIKTKENNVKFYINNEYIKAIIILFMFFLSLFLITIGIRRHKLSHQN